MKTYSPCWPCCTTSVGTIRRLICSPEGASAYSSGLRTRERRGGGRPIRRRFGLHRFLDRLLLGLRRSLRFAELFNRRRFLPGLRTVWRQCRCRLSCDWRFFLGLRRNTSGKRRDLCGFSRGPCLSRATPPPLMSPDFRRRPLRPSRGGRHQGARSNP